MEPKESGSGGGRTAFEGMSHEQMLAWLDQASSFHVQAAADRLWAASAEIGKIAQQLKFRPERVEWKGEGFQAFVDWGASLASATQRLSDYSEEASNWLSRASESIATAQSAIPRYTSPEQAQANLDAAKAARNDTDSATVRSKAEAALAATQEKNRLDAAAEMSKLAGSYATSSAEIGKLELPTFQPPPDQFVPDTGSGYNSVQDIYRSSGDTGSSSAERSYAPTQERATVRDEVSPVGVDTGVGTTTTRPVDRPVDMEIDSVATLPDVHPTPPTTGGLPPVGKPDGTPPVLPGMAPPVLGANSRVPTASSPGGRAVPSARGMVPPGQTGVPPRMARADGIVGGRPVPPATGRPTGGIPRGTVIGHEGTTGARGQMGRGMAGMPGMHGGGPMGGAGQSGISGGRRLASEAGGVVGGRQQPGQTSARPFTPGGSGLVRGANDSNPRREERNGRRADYLTEDEETWQQGGRPVVPPVID